MNLSPIQFILTFIILLAFLTETQGGTNNTDSSSIKNKSLYKVLILESAYYAGAITILQNTWYKDKKGVPFHFYNDNKGFLQVDKFGHTFGAYIESYIGYESLINAGLSRRNALIYGGTLGIVLQTPIEIMDGTHEGWGFSWGDMAANALGSSLVIGQELLFNDQIIKYKFSYWESGYARKAHGYLGTTTFNRLLKDYNGHTYWLSMPINLIIPSSKIPKWLNIAFGYGANGMYGEYENISSYNGFVIPNTTRYRQYLLSLDVDWTRIKTKSKFLNIILRGMTFIKLPFPAIEYNSKGQFKVYALYY